MKPLLAIISVLFSTSFCVAQQDTTVVYKTRNMSICTKASAVYLIKFYKAGQVWQRTTYDIKKNQIVTDATFNEDTDDDEKLLVFKTYNDKGYLFKVENFEKGKVVKGAFYYENGQLNGEAEFDRTGKVTYEKGYDSTGKELADYVFIKESEFEGGMLAWQRYLMRNLNSDIVRKYSAPPAKYTVTVAFVIGKDGSVIDAKAENDPGYGTKDEAIRVVLNGPKWQPAIYNGKPVISRKRQQITFMSTGN